MEQVADILIFFIDLLTDTKILGVPLIVWTVIPLLLGLLVNFLKGKKE